MDADVQAWIARANKALGDDTFILASELHIPRRFTTGSLGLDVILGGGIPGNQWMEVVGKESAGKTATIFKALAANQLAEPTFQTLWVAGEHFDTDQAVALGVDLNRVTLFPHGQEMETAFQAMIDGAESRAFDCIVLDSYPALIAAEEDEKAMDQATMAKGAQLMGKFIRKAGKATRRAPDGSERPMFGIIVNQWRAAIGQFSRFGTPNTTPGGNGKNYFFYVRLEVARVKYLTEKRPGVTDPVTVGQTIKFRTLKNKAAAPQQTHELDFYSRGAPTLGFRRGEYDLGKEYFALAKAFGILKVKGSYYQFGDQQWQGTDKTLAALRSEPSLMAEVREQVMEKAANPKALDELAS